MNQITTHEKKKKKKQNKIVDISKFNMNEQY